MISRYSKAAGILKLYGSSTAVVQGLQQSVNLQSAADECYSFDSSFDPESNGQVHIYIYEPRDELLVMCQDAPKQTSVFVRVDATVCLSILSICQSLEL